MSTDPQDGAFVPPRATQTPLRGIPASPPDTPNGQTGAQGLTDAAESLLADTVIAIGTALLNGTLFGQWDDYETAYTRLAHVLHGMECARSGAATELDYYGSDT